MALVSTHLVIMASVAKPDVAVIDLADMDELPAKRQIAQASYGFPLSPSYLCVKFSSPLTLR